MFLFDFRPLFLFVFRVCEFIVLELSFLCMFISLIVAGGFVHGVVVVLHLVVHCVVIMVIVILHLSSLHWYRHCCRLVLELFGCG